MIAFAIRNLLVSLLLAAGLAGAGFWAWRQVPVDAIPDLSDNQVIVWAEWPGKSPEDMDRQITSRLTRELQGLPGVRVVRGMSMTGSAYVYVIFEDNRDLYDCRTRVLERLAQSGGLLPQGVVARLGPDATAMGQVYAFTLQGDIDVERRRFVLDQVVVPALQAVPGVAEVAPAGGVVREYQVDFDPLRLEAQGLSVGDVMEAMRAGGRDVGAMSVELSGVETMIRGIGFLRTLEDIENIIVRGDPMAGAGVRLGDIADVKLGGRFRQGLLADGYREQVGAIVAMRVGEDPQAVIAAVKKRLAGLAPTLQAEGLSPVAFYDRSRLIAETNATVTATLREAVVTTIIVVAAFLLHLRASLATAVSLPLGMLFSFLMMHLAGVGANLMSLAGIAIAIGVMVDFGIVMTENITQHLADLKRRCREQGRPMPVSPWDPEVVDTIVAGANEVTRPLVTSAATTVIGFLPILALTDQAGRLFVPLAITKTLAISGAVLVGVFLVPVLCRLLLPPWQARRGPLLAVAGLAAGATFGWLWNDGLAFPVEHGRLAVSVPGWLLAPAAAILVGSAVWRLGRERLLEVDDNPTSRVIEVVFNRAYTIVQDQRLAFLGALGVIVVAGCLVGPGWPRLSWPLRELVARAGGDLGATRLDRQLTAWFPGIGSSFLPPLDEGGLLFMPSVPATAGLGETERVMMIQNRAIESVPEVEAVMGKLGRAETALDPAPIGMIETVVILKPYREWPVHRIKMPDGTEERRPRTLAEVRSLLAAVSDIPGVAPSWLQPIETRVVMLSTGIRSLLALQVLGDDRAALERFAEAAEKIVQGTPGVADAQMQREGGKPYFEFRLDPARLARFGLSAEMVLETIEVGLGGMEIATTVEGTLRYPVRMRVMRERRDDLDELLDLRVGMNGGKESVPLALLLAAPQVHALSFPKDGFGPDAILPLLHLDAQRGFTALGPTRAELVLPAGEDLPRALQDAIGRGDASLDSTRPSPVGVTPVIGPMAIRTEGGQRVQYVMFNTSDGSEVGVVREASRRLEAAIAEGRLELPSGVSYRWVGRYEQKLKADRTLTGVIAVSMAIMIVLIYIGTRSWLVTAVIVGCNAIVNVSGGFIMVWAWGAEFTTAVTVGFLVLLGVMFNDNILLGTYLHEQFRDPPKDAAEVRRRVFEASLRRRRPALMTNVTTLLSLIPVLWAAGRGSEVMQPMVLPVIGGMIVDFLSLFSVPVFYAWAWERKLARAARR